MGTLHVWIYDTAGGATSAAHSLHTRRLLQSGEVACILSWPREQEAPTFELIASGRAPRPERSGALAGWLTDLFLGVFMDPLQSTADVDVMNLDLVRPRLGLAAVTVNRLRDDVTPGASALLITDAARINAIDDHLTAERSARRWMAEAELLESA